MRCPFCGHSDTQVKDSRPSEDGLTIRRRRFCPECNSRFTTFERVHLRELTVLKKNGERRVFDREKIAKSIQMAMRKRPIDADVVEQVISKLVRELESQGEGEIPSTLIGEMVMDGLKELDKVAYIRFASVYKNFTDAKDFEDFVDSLEKITKKKK